MWRVNSIANLYHVRAMLNGRSIMNVFRHGVVGFGKHTSDMLTVHLTEALRYAVETHHADFPSRRGFTASTRVRDAVAHLYFRRVPHPSTDLPPSHLATSPPPLFVTPAT